MTNDKTQNSLNQTYFKLISLKALLAIPKPPFGIGEHRLRTHTCSLSVNICRLYSVNIRLKWKSSLTFETRNKALTSIVINIFGNSLQLKPRVNHWWSLSDTRIQTNTINGKTSRSVMSTSGRTGQSTYKLPWLSVGHSVTLYAHYGNCVCQLTSMDVHTPYFWSESICTKTKQARCSACNETTIRGWAYGISILPS